MADTGRVTGSTPIFACADVPATAAWYRDVLGFELLWTWGEPPTFAAVRLNDAELFLSSQPDLAAHAAGHQHWFGVDDADAMHARHRARGAAVVEPLGDRPWNVREYVVRDPNGYHLRFAGPLGYTRPAGARDAMPAHVRIDPRLPTPAEFIAVYEVMGWNKDYDTVAPALAASLCGVVAVDTQAGDTGAGRVVGMARAVGDGARVAYVQDVMVLPDYQHQRIGSGLMAALMAALRRRCPRGTHVYLFTGKPAFYHPFGFRRDPYGMVTVL